MSRWVGQSGDGERSLRASSGQMENGNERAWGTRKAAEEQEQTDYHNYKTSTVNRHRI